MAGLLAPLATYRLPTSGSGALVACAYSALAYAPSELDAASAATMGVVMGNNVGASAEAVSPLTLAGEVRVLPMLFLSLSMDDKI